MNDKLLAVGMLCLILMSFCSFVLGIVRDKEIIRMFEEIQEGRNE